MTLDVAPPGSAELLYKLMTADETWTLYNGPYFGYQRPSFDEFRERRFKRLQAGDDAQVIFLEGRPVGEVSFYWESESTRWLEAGIAIYDSSVWGRGIGHRALQQWTTRLFERLEVERVGLTTWSGNPGMMTCALKAGYRLEGRLRKVRFYQGEYYDSLRYGVLRSEWGEPLVPASPSSDSLEARLLDTELLDTISRMESRLCAGEPHAVPRWCEVYTALAARFAEDLGAGSRETLLARSGALMMLQALAENGIGGETSRRAGGDIGPGRADAREKSP
ncbi:GNAT family N-acetyltransferase [Salinicola rhizosphaerae]|uniref:GNAT family N-acetyltransferase n=1 Tax=Salinicola rhizosphaerae TaxID=1443141 RepID=UPI001E3707A1|nr:GNAT family protein [Salinicola rhizosphaerae]